MAEGRLITSESVSEGHPDKMCDQISDAVLDAVLEQDPHGRVGCETLVKTGMVVLAGEITTSADIDYENLVREVVKGVGYDNRDVGFDGLHLRGADPHRPAVHRHRRGCQRTQRPRAGGRRPGHDVRLRDGRDRRPDAGADHIRTPPDAATVGGAPQRHTALASPRREEPGDLPLRRRAPDRGGRGGALHSARTGSRRQRTE